MICSKESQIIGRKELLRPKITKLEICLPNYLLGKQESCFCAIVLFSQDLGKGRYSFVYLRASAIFCTRSDNSLGGWNKSQWRQSRDFPKDGTCRRTNRWMGHNLRWSVGLKGRSSDLSHVELHWCSCCPAFRRLRRRFWDHLAG